MLEWLPADAPPLGTAGRTARVAVDRRSGALATAATPAAEIEPRTFVDLPTRYAGWLVRQGLPGLPDALADAARRADGARAELAGALRRSRSPRPSPARACCSTPRRRAS